MTFGNRNEINIAGVKLFLIVVSTCKFFKYALRFDLNSQGVSAQVRQKEE